MKEFKHYCEDEAINISRKIEKYMKEELQKNLRDKIIYKIDNKETDELALIIGHLYGDGGITNKGRVHYCNSEDFLIEEFVNSMNKIFKIKPWIKRELNITRVRYPVNVGRICGMLSENSVQEKIRK